jgi:hypothetical protein
MNDTLNFHGALAGLYLIANGRLSIDDPVEAEPRVCRLIERLLDQLEVKGRVATESEDTFLRNAIGYYEDAFRDVQSHWTTTGSMSVAGSDLSQARKAPPPPPKKK